MSETQPNQQQSQEEIQNKDDGYESIHSQENEENNSSKSVSNSTSQESYQDNQDNKDNQSTVETTVEVRVEPNNGNTGNPDNAQEDVQESDEQAYEESTSSLNSSNPSNQSSHSKQSGSNDEERVVSGERNLSENNPKRYPSFTFNNGTLRYFFDGREVSKGLFWKHTKNFSKKFPEHEYEIDGVFYTYKEWKKHIKKLERKQK